MDISLLYEFLVSRAETNIQVFARLSWSLNTKGYAMKYFSTVILAYFTTNF